MANRYLGTDWFRIFAGRGCVHQSQEVAVRFHARSLLDGVTRLAGTRSDDREDVHIHDAGVVAAPKPNVAVDFLCARCVIPSRLIKCMISIDIVENAIRPAHVDCTRGFVWIWDGLLAEGVYSRDCSNELRRENIFGEFHSKSSPNRDTVHELSTWFYRSRALTCSYLLLAVLTSVCVRARILPVVGPGFVFGQR